MRQFAVTEHDSLILLAASVFHSLVVAERGKNRDPVTAIYLSRITSYQWLNILTAFSHDDQEGANTSKHEELVDE